jgi:hypothetical protein
LADLYAEPRLLDLTLEHRKGQLRTLQPRPGESEADFEARRGRLSKHVAEMQNQYEKTLDILEVNASKLKPDDRAAFAFEKGLARKALDILLATDASGLGKAALRLELELMITSGRIDELRKWVKPEHLEAIGATNYYWLLSRAAAGAGDYLAAEEYLEKMSESLHPVSPRPGSKFTAVLPPRPAMALGAAQAVLENRLPGGGPGHLAATILNRLMFLGRMAPFVAHLREETNLLALRGQLALEAGDLEKAKRCWKQALAAWQSEVAVAKGGGVDFGARPIVQQGLEMLAKYGSQDKR